MPSLMVGGFWNSSACKESRSGSVKASTINPAATNPTPKIIPHAVHRHCLTGLKKAVIWSITMDIVVPLIFQVSHLQDVASKVVVYSYANTGRLSVNSRWIVALLK